MKLCKYPEKGAIGCSCIWNTAVSKHHGKKRGQCYPKYHDRCNDGSFVAIQSFNKCAHNKISCTGINSCLDLLPGNNASYTNIHRKIQDRYTDNRDEHAPGYVPSWVFYLTPKMTNI